MLKKNNENNNKRLQNALLFGTFLFHIVWSVYMFNTNNIVFIEIIQIEISNNYGKVGFEWNGTCGYLMTAALLSSFFMNATRRIFEGVFMGWPRFGKHDKHSLISAFILLISYGLMMYFAVGFMGEKFSFKKINFVNLLLISISTYIAGLMVDFFDDFISGIFCIYREGKK